jgi:hypothetical protein
MCQSISPIAIKAEYEWFGFNDGSVPVDKAEDVNQVANKNNKKDDDKDVLGELVNGMEKRYVKPDIKSNGNIVIPQARL